MISVLLRILWWLVSRVGTSIVTGAIVERLLFGRKRGKGDSAPESAGESKR